MRTLTNREFAGRISELILEIREDYRNCYDKTELEYICERLADKVRDALSYDFDEYYLVKSYLKEIKTLEDDMELEYYRLHSDFMDDFYNIIDYDCLFDMYYDLKDPNGNLIFVPEDEDFDLVEELEAINSNPNNLAYELVREKAEYYFTEVYIPEETYEWGEAHDYDNLAWAHCTLVENTYLLSPQEQEFMNNLGKEVK